MVESEALVLTMRALVQHVNLDGLSKLRDLDWCGIQADAEESQCTYLSLFLNEVNSMLDTAHGPAAAHEPRKPGASCDDTIQLAMAFKKLSSVEALAEQTNFHIAASKLRVEELAALLATGRVDVNRPNSEGRTALSTVCRLGYMANIQSFEEALAIFDPDRNSRPDSSSEAATLFMAKKGENADRVLACARLLLENGAEPNLLDRHGCSPLAGARSLFSHDMKGPNPLEALLLEFGAQRNQNAGTIQLGNAKRSLWELKRCAALCAKGRASAVGHEGERLLAVGSLPEPVLVNIMAWACAPSPSAGLEGCGEDLARLLRVTEQRKFRNAPSGAVWSFLEYAAPQAAGQSSRGVCVMLPSSFFSASLFEEVAPWLATRLGLRVMCFDLLGNGLSSSAERHSLVSMADDLASFLRYEEVIHLCGVSVGCDIAIHIAQRLPAGSLRSATLSCFASKEAPPEQVHGFMAGFMEGLRAQGPQMLLDYMKTPGMMGKRYLEEEAFEDSRKQLWKMVAGSSMEEATRVADLWNNRTGPPPYQDLQCPVLLLCGADDLQFIDNTQFLLANLPEECKAQVGIIPEVGHQIPIEAPDQMAHHIIEWMHTTVN